MIGFLAKKIMVVLRRHGVRLEHQLASDQKHTISGYFNDTRITISIQTDAMDSYAQNTRLPMINEGRIDMFLRSLVQQVYRQCEGDGPAIDVVNAVIAHGATIYPQDGLRGLSCLQVIAKLSLYGDQINALYVEFCKRKISRFIALFRAVTMGYIHESDIFRYSEACFIGDIDHFTQRNHLMDAELIYDAVKRGLPEFDVPEPEASCV